VRAILISILKTYRALFSPVAGALGARCRFHPTCSEYAIEAFERFPISRAFILTARRILRCGPWSAGGVDRVPAC
jgi:putative membrane protein insertion efficiency factor